MKTTFGGLAVLLLIIGCGPKPNDCTIDGGVPGPGGGDQVDIAFNDIEPNNTPEQATPLGVSTETDLYPWVNSNTIGGADNPADYFVFQSAPKAGLFEFNMCFNAPLTGMTASLWKVNCGVQQTPPIGTWTVSNTCASTFTAPLEASTVYLFGVFATGEAGTYNA
jgi:hypothetical protein